MAETITPVERTLRYATSVVDLTAAWAFVMEYVDKVGDAPTIEINPFWSSSDDFEGRKFIVVVSGMEHEVSGG